MAQRTTATAVEDTLGPHYDGTTNLQTFIDTASNLVDWLVAQDTTSTLSAATLELIERWLGGHFYAHADQMMKSKSTDGASATFQGTTSMVLHSTMYGQNALLLDTTGNLTRRSKEAETGVIRKASARWLGKPKSRRIDYKDRD